MNRKLFDKLACPYDKQAPLTLTVFREHGDSVTQGLLECELCRRYYPIIGSVPVLLPDEFRDPAVEAPFLAKWRPAIGDRFSQGRGFHIPPPAGTMLPDETV